MRRTVKSVASNLVATVELVRDRIEICGLRKTRVKCRIEYSDLRNRVTEYGTRSGDASQIVRVMKGREVYEFLQLSIHWSINERRFRETLAAVDNPMTNGFDFFH